MSKAAQEMSRIAKALGVTGRRQHKRSGRTRMQDDEIGIDPEAGDGHEAGASAETADGDQPDASEGAEMKKKAGRKKKATAKPAPIKKQAAKPRVADGGESKKKRSMHDVDGSALKALKGAAPFKFVGASAGEGTQYLNVDFAAGDGDPLRVRLYPVGFGASKYASQASKLIADWLSGAVRASKA